MSNLQELVKQIWLCDDLLFLLYVKLNVTCPFLKLILVQIQDVCEEEQVFLKE